MSDHMNDEIEMELLRSELEEYKQQLAWCQEDYKDLARYLQGRDLKRHQDRVRELRGEAE